MADEFDVTLKKKKKKKTVAFSDEVLDQENASGEQSPSREKGGDDGKDVEAMFSDLKKKKKKKKKSLTSGDGEDAVAEEEADAEVKELDESLEELSLKKKKKLPVEDENEEAGETEVEGGSGPSSAQAGEDEDDDQDDDIADDDVEMAEDSEKEDSLAQNQTFNVDYENMEKSWQENDRDYTYNELLTRVFYIIRQKNPEFSGEKRKYLMVPPKVAREGSKKTAFSNIIDICNRMHRLPEHLIAYIYAELGTQGSMDGSQRLIIKGRFQPKQIENVLKHYIQEYVTCKTCRSPDTSLKKENKLFFLQCAVCGSSRAVTAIKSGFKAQTEKRKTMRQ